MKLRPVPLQRYLESNAALAELRRQVHQADHWLSRVHAALPADLSSHLPAVRPREGILVLYADSPVWASRLRYTIPRIRNQLPEFREIRIRVLPNTMPPDVSKNRRRPKAMKRETADMIRGIACAVPDKQLSLALKRLADQGRKGASKY